MRYKILLLLNLLWRMCKLKKAATSKSGKTPHISPLLMHNMSRHYIYTLRALELPDLIEVDQLESWVNLFRFDLQRSIALFLQINFTRFLVADWLKHCFYSTSSIFGISESDSQRHCLW